MLFFSTDPAPTEIYTLSLHDALPICPGRSHLRWLALHGLEDCSTGGPPTPLHRPHRSEEHTSELQSHSDLVCRLLLEKKKITNTSTQNGGAIQGGDLANHEPRSAPHH